MDEQHALDGYSSPATPNSLSRPRPWPQRSPSQAAKIRVRNRRWEYLNRNPKYFSSTEQEFADPDIYDKLIRKFQSPAEREAEGRSKGWGKTLESSLMRGEARLERVTSPAAVGTASTADSAIAHTPNDVTREIIDFSVADLVDDKPATKEQGRATWAEFLRERFVRGGDEDFDYGQVDENEDLDSLEHMDREEAYFDDEEPEWADDSDIDDKSTTSAADDAANADGRQRPRRERILVGQTGVQDF